MTNRKLQESAFNRKWQYRINTLLPILKNYKSILDLGSGTQGILEYLDVEKYTGVDMFAWTDDTIVCDFNKYSIPAVGNYDVVLCQGIIEYINDPKKFLTEIQEHSNNLVVTFYENDPPLELWKTPLKTFREFEKLLVDVGWRWERVLEIEPKNKQRIYICTKQ